MLLTPQPNGRVQSSQGNPGVTDPSIPQRHQGPVVELRVKATCGARDGQPKGDTMVVSVLSR